MEALLSWQCYEHAHTERGSDWYWALGIIAVSGALTSILFSNILFALIIILAACILGLIASQPPELTTIGIYERGLRVGDMLHRWEDVISFWVEEEHEEPRLLVDTTKVLSPNLIIPLTDVNPEDVRTLMQQFAEEKFLQEPLSHKLIELLGF
jgi:hypothetical protein